MGRGDQIKQQPIAKLDGREEWGIPRRGGGVGTSIHPGDFRMSRLAPSFTGIIEWSCKLTRHWPRAPQPLRKATCFTWKFTQSLPSITIGPCSWSFRTHRAPFCHRMKNLVKWFELSRFGVSTRTLSGDCRLTRITLALFSHPPRMISVKGRSSPRTDMRPMWQLLGPLNSTVRPPWIMGMKLYSRQSDVFTSWPPGIGSFAVG